MQYALYAKQFQPHFNPLYLARSQTYQQVKSGDIIKLGRLSEPEISDSVYELVMNYSFLLSSTTKEDAVILAH